MQKRRSIDEGQVSFARDLGLFEATMLGVGAMIGAGIFVLTGVAVGESGPASILAFALNGLVTLFTAFSYAELTSAIPEAGGGYTFVKKAFPGAVGFVSGWMLWFARIIACSLYAVGFGGYFWEFFKKYLPFITDLFHGYLGVGFTTGLAILAVGLFFISLNIRGTGITGKTENVVTMGKIVILAVFIYYGLHRVFSEPGPSLASFTPFFPKGFGGVTIAMGLTFIAFEGYDLIANVSEEVKDPEKNIPRAIFIAIGLTLTLYMLVLFVSLAATRPAGMASWEFLGSQKEVAIVKAAENFMPWFGVGIIVFGGLLSTMSALNATVMASSRVAFSMGRDRWLPPALARIHPVMRTPYVAIMVTGILLLTIALSFPLEVVGSATSVLFLLTFAMVNLSAIVLRRKMPDIDRKYRIPFYPLTPILGIVTSTGLALYQYRFQPITWYISLALMAVGLMLYFIYFQRIHEEPPPVVVEATRQAPALRKQYRVLVPINDPATVEPIMDLAIPLAKAQGGEIVALSMVIIPRQLPIAEGMKIAHHQRPLLRRAVEYGRKDDVEVRTDLRIAHRTSQGILAAAEEEEASFILMEWRGYARKPRRVFGVTVDTVSRYAPCDLGVVRFGRNVDYKRILLPTAGGPHARLASRLVPSVADRFGASVTSAYVIPKGTGPEGRERAMAWIDKTLEDTGLAGKVEKVLIESESVAAGILRAAKEYDLVVIGAAKEKFFAKILFGVIPERVARHSSATVLMVKGYEGRVKGWFKKIFG